jgi:hypothetical protein
MTPFATEILIVQNVEAWLEMENGNFVAEIWMESLEALFVETMLMHVY